MGSQPSRLPLFDFFEELPSQTELIDSSQTDQPISAPSSLSQDDVRKLAEDQTSFSSEEAD